MALIFKRKLAPSADPLVADAVKAKLALTDNEKSLAAWKKFPAPDAKRIACPFCGHAYYNPCGTDEHERCMNFHDAEKKKVSP